MTTLESTKGYPSISFRGVSCKFDENGIGDLDMNLSASDLTELAVFGVVPATKKAPEKPAPKAVSRTTPTTPKPTETKKDEVEVSVAPVETPVEAPVEKVEEPEKDEAVHKANLIERAATEYGVKIDGRTSLAVVEQKLKDLDAKKGK